MTSANAPVPTDGDPAARPARRTFPAEYKLRIVAEYDAASSGEKGAILRRERLYHSHVIEWRRARGAGAMHTLTGQRTSPARPKPGREAAEVARLRAENQRLKKDLAKKDAALVVLGKLTRSWRCSPRARTDPRPHPAPGRCLRGTRTPPRHYGRVPVDRSLPRQPPPAPEPAPTDGAGAAPASGLGPDRP